MVQGAGAADDIAAAIDLLNDHGGLDVLIVGRGGGSLEDLWAFNEEPVARAIWRSKVPVISAVGHEIDFTISDFVADLRAATPSAAAELVVGRKDEFLQSLSDTSLSLGRILRQSLLEYQARFNALSGSYVFREPQSIIKAHGERLSRTAAFLLDDNPLKRLFALLCPFDHAYHDADGVANLKVVVFLGDMLLLYAVDVVHHAAPYFGKSSSFNKSGRSFFVRSSDEFRRHFSISL